ncbi:hypothetical protein LguiB_016373 [Lonicera macranthoides]
MAVGSFHMAAVVNPVMECSFLAATSSSSLSTTLGRRRMTRISWSRTRSCVSVLALNNRNSSSGGDANYVVPLDFSTSSSSCITRPLAEILRDLNKRIPDNIIINHPPPASADDDHHRHSTFIPWYHANRMLSFYAPGWCGEIRDVIFSDNGSVTVVYRVTIRGSDGEAHRESTGSVSSAGGDFVDPVAAAEEIAFCRACARFGLGLYLFHEE